VCKVNIISATIGDTSQVPYAETSTYVSMETSSLATLMFLTNDPEERGGRGREGEGGGGG
jgi:hypothetical protein